MQITYFHWNNCAPSIVRSFRPLIDTLQKSEDVIEYYVPHSGSLPWNIVRNILFVYKHRNENGINHITGDIHYCILGLIGTKSVLTIHDNYAMIKAKYGVFDKIFKYLFWFFLPILFAKKVLCISNATFEKVNRLVPNKKNTILFQHSLSKGFSNSDKEFNTAKPVVLQLGASVQKNLEATIMALEGIPCHLRVIKKMTKSQTQLAEKLNIEYSNIYNISDEAIIEEYKNADIIAFPSLLEGFGMPIIEAQAMGRVCITSNIEPMNWVAGQGAELLDDPTNIESYRSSLLRCIADSQYREQLISKGQENVQRFKIENITPRFFDLYKTVLEEK